jgi:uncharacterized membrane protein YcaP (DUF421 family)
LLGEAPIGFLGEVFVRSLVTYIVLLVTLKFLGKRMSGRLSNTEMAVMLMFGAVVSSAMQIPERGVVEGSFVLLLILVFQRLFTLWTFRNRRLEKLTLGTTSLLIKNGVIQHSFMEKELLSQNQLFRQLRGKKIIQLGELRRVYMETNGSFTIIPFDKAVPGLSILPGKDNELKTLLEEEPGLKACGHCGQSCLVKPVSEACSHCHQQDWKPAVLKKQTDEKRSDRPK